MIRRPLRRPLFLCCMLLAIQVPPASAQTARPSVVSPTAQEPAALPADAGEDSGTTIVGERESPIGLYITPWRNAYAEQDIDRPARLLQVDMSPVDRTVFTRQVEYYDALTEAAQAKQPPPVAAPALPSP